MHRERDFSPPVPGWVALREPSSSSSSESEADAEDDMDDRITGRDKAFSNKGIATSRRPTSSYSLSQQATTAHGKRKDSDSSSFEREKSRKRARHDHDQASPSRAAGERRGGVSGSGEVRTSNMLARSSRPSNSDGATSVISVSRSRPSAPSSSSSSATTRPPAHPLPKEPRASTAAKDGLSATSAAPSSSSVQTSSKPSSSASSSLPFKKKEFQSKLSSDLFNGAGRLSSQAYKHLVVTQSRKDDTIIDLTIDDDNNSPPPYPKLKAKPRASMPNAVVIDMSDEERPESEASTSALRGRPKGKTRKSTGVIEESEVIVISSDEEEKAKEKEREKEKEGPAFAVLVRRPPAFLRSAMPMPKSAPAPLSEPSSIQRQSSHAKDISVKASVPSSTSMVSKTPITSLSNAESVSVPAPSSTVQVARQSQATEKIVAIAPSSRVAGSDEHRSHDDDRMNIDVPPALAPSILNVVGSHNPSALVDGEPSSTLISKSTLSQGQKQKQDQAQDVHVNAATPLTQAIVGSLVNPKTPTSAIVDASISTPTRGSSIAGSSTIPASKLSSPVNIHRPSSSLDAQSRERSSEQMPPQAMEVDQPQPDAASLLSASPTAIPAGSTHKRIPSASALTPAVPGPQTPSQPLSNPRLTARSSQIAVKSTGGAKPRLPQRRLFSPSSSPSKSHSESSSDLNERIEKDQEVVEENADSAAAFSGPSTGLSKVAETASRSGGIDMRDLDNALGLSQLSPNSQKQHTLSPERPAPVKEQPITPRMPKPSASQTKHVARKSNAGQDMSSLPQVLMSAMRANAELHAPRRARNGAKEKGAAGPETTAPGPRQVIDLTLDDSDEESEKEADESSKDADLSDLQIPMEGLQRLNESREENEASSVAVAEFSRSSPETESDELLLRLAHGGFENEPSLPPSSPSSPPPSSLDIPVVPEVQPPTTAAAFTASQPVIGPRHHSAPLESVAQAPESLMSPSSPGCITSTLPAPQSPVRPQPQMRPASISSIDEIRAPKSIITDASPALRANSIPSVSAESPTSSPHRPLRGSALKQEHRLFSNETTLEVPLTGGSPDPLDETPVIPSAKALGKRPQRAFSSDDMEMDVDKQESFFTQSEDEAIQEAEEVQALVEVTSTGTGRLSSAEDHSPNAMAELEALSEVVAIPAPSTSSSSAPTDGEAGPSSGLRRSSRHSCISSSGGQSIEPFSEEENALATASVPPSRCTTPEEGTSLAEGASPIKRKTYGGFEALTWREYRKDLNNFIPKCRYARDLPHSFQDHINRMSSYVRMMPDMRLLFEAMIRENTVLDEPDAPPIELENDVDDEPTPLWEFYYTNEMWHGEGVPPPDIKSLVSCNCKGGCNPRSKTCACLKRQREEAGNPTLEFAYDKNGRLKIPGFPVFECNDMCGCGPECQNRVVQHGRKVQVMIKKTQHKGWGVFAGGKKIPSHTFIGVYSGELLTDNEAQDRGVYYNKTGRTYLFDLDFHHQKGPNWENQYTVDAYHAGNFTRFLNHSCDPNARLYPCYINEGNIQKPLLVIFSRRDIEPGEEICFSYSGNYPGDDDDDEDEQAQEGGSEGEGGDEEGKRDKVYGACKCGAKNCTGIVFRPPPSPPED